MGDVDMINLKCTIEKGTDIRSLISKTTKRRYNNFTQNLTSKKS